MRAKAFLNLGGTSTMVDHKLIDVENSSLPTLMANGIGGVKNSITQCYLEKFICSEGGRKMKESENKPEYRIMSMKEIEETRGTNGFNVVSTFSGCGGSCLGFEMAGFKILYANEFVESARDVYVLNHPGVFVESGDIRNISAEDILNRVNLKRGEVDVLEGSPPCASFSTAGKRSKKWGATSKYSDTKQVVDDLFFEFIRIIRGVMPKVFVAENVSGLIKGVAKGYFKMIFKEMKDSGYDVESRLLDAQWMGVPQRRQRVIFMGVRKDLNLKPSYPTPLPYRYTIADACPWMIRADEDTGGKFSCGDFTNGVVPTVRQGGIGHLKATVRKGDESIIGTAIEKEWKKMKIGSQSRKYFNLVKVDPKKPSPTICQSHGSKGVALVVHPYERRKFTIAELKRVCGFPDDFVLTGSYAKQWERLGRAVPPPMMMAVAESIRDNILCKTVKKRRAVRRCAVS